MKPPYPSPTPTWHNGVYAGIDAQSLGQIYAGKTVVVVGAGSGIGRATALAYAATGVGCVVLVGRTQATLDETKELIPGGGIRLSTFVCDVTREEEVQRLAESVGGWDVFVLSGGGIQPPAPIVNMGVGECWSSFEGNVKSLINAAHYLVPKAKPEASLVALTSGNLVLPVQFTLNQADYQVSKLAQVKMIEYLAAENQDVAFFAVHPGLVDTKIYLTSGADPKMLPMDTPELAAGFLTWITSPRGRFLNGRMVFANWDVKELEGMKEEITSSGLMTIGYNGWPFPHVG